MQYTSCMHVYAFFLSEVNFLLFKFLSLAKVFVFIFLLVFRETSLFDVFFGKSPPYGCGGGVVLSSLASCWLVWELNNIDLRFSLSTL